MKDQTLHGKFRNSNYYEDLIAASDIGEIADELIPERITHRNGNQLLCDCPNHASKSKTSLHINLDSQLWYCFGCRTGGNVIHFVEFFNSGNVSKGISGAKTKGHRDARDFLAKRADMPLLDASGRNSNQIEASEMETRMDARTYECLTVIADYYNKQLINNRETMEWFSSKYAISEKTVAELKIGYSANGQGDDSIIKVFRNHNFSEAEILSTGAFVKTSRGLVPLFQNRITFPYWSKGKGVVYMIGRKTPWTPEKDYESGKYKKLLVHSDKHPSVRACINNSTIYNEDCLAKAPSVLIITEGVTDTISAAERGFDVISPVTVKFKKTDQDRLKNRLNGYAGKVVIVQDNEISEVGLKNSVDTARMLFKMGIDARIGELPLGQKQKDARQALLDKYGIDAKTVSNDRTRNLNEDEEEIVNLLGQAKIDINEYFMEGHVKEDFEAILAKAVDPIEWSIGFLKPGIPRKERSTTLNPILSDIAELDPLDAESYLRLIKEKIDGEISLNALRKQMSKAAEVEEDSSEDKKSHFNRLYDLFNESGSTAFLDQHHGGWATMKINDHFENVPINSNKFARVMLDLYYNKYRAAVDFRVIELFKALLTQRATVERNLYNRYAWIERRLLIDMGTKDWSMIEVSENGWKILQSDSPVFKRFSHQKPFPEPKRNGDVKKILKYLAINDPGNQALLIVWLCTCMLEFAPRPGLILYGLQGSAKTSASDFVRMVVDPSTILHSSLSKDLTEFIQRMDHHAIVSLDNLSSIPQWASDALCGCTTGAGFQKRMLYTDDDDITYSFRRAFILNGISIPSKAPDLLDRSITIELARINTKGRKREAKIKKEFLADLPDILGGILDVMVQVIARRDEELDDYPRLADWYGLAYIAAEVLGVKDDFKSAFNRSEKEQHREILESHLVTELLLEFMEDRDRWQGTKTDLHRDLGQMAEERKSSREWPKTAAQFGKRLKPLYHNLAEMGFICEEKLEAKKRLLTITKEKLSEPDKASPSDSGDILKVPGSTVSTVTPVNTGNIDRLSETGTQNSAVSDSNESVTIACKRERTEARPGKTTYSGLPVEVLSWNDVLQEDYRNYYSLCLEEDYSPEDAERFAIEKVKNSEVFAYYHRDHANRPVSEYNEGPVVSINMETSPASQTEPEPVIEPYWDSTPEDPAPWDHCTLEGNDFISELMESPDDESMYERERKVNLRVVDILSGARAK